VLVYKGGRAVTSEILYCFLSQPDYSIVLCKFYSIFKQLFLLSLAFETLPAFYF